MAPQTVKKVVRETVRAYDAVAEVVAQYGADVKTRLEGDVRVEDIPILIASLEKEMKDLAKAMEFEKAATLRDEIGELRKLLGVSDGRLGLEKRRLPAGRTRR